MRAISKKGWMLGEFAVGKTRLAERFVYNRFSHDYISSIGVKVSRKRSVVPRDGEVIEFAMIIWDIAGRNGVHQVILPSYMRGAAGAVLVCDLTRPNTLGSLRTYAQSLRLYSPEAALVSAANKRDRVKERGLSDEGLSQAAGELRAPLLITSAREGHGRGRHPAGALDRAPAGGVSRRADLVRERPAAGQHVLRDPADHGQRRRVAGRGAA